MPKRKRDARAPIVRKPSGTSVGKRRRRWALAVGLLAVIAGVVLWWFRFPWGWQWQADDPRLTVATPFRNVRPEVHYVGDAACADCHPAITASYRQHPMGRSLAPIGAAASIERYDAAARNPFETQGFQYRVERSDERIIHKESIGAIEARAEMAFAVGSGRRGRSYLIDRDGYLFQSPITWYPLKGIWDLSPGYDEYNQHMSRPIIPACLSCHCNQADPVGHAANRYRSPIFLGHAIGCERCHGPGELHVAQQSAGKTSGAIDTTIVNPRHLEPPLRESVCQQCHLQGEVRVQVRGRAEFDFRPGLPLNRFVVDFVRPSDHRPSNKFVGTVEQMYASQCFQKSAGDAKLGCISCHDPHALPSAADRDTYFRGRCLVCHAEKGCSLLPAARRAASDNCIACHMPKRKSSVVHTAITDHAIPRRGDTNEGAAKSSDWPRPGQMPLVAFPPDLPQISETELERCLGLALVDAARKKTSGPSGRPFAELALPRLDAATADDARDVAAWEAKATALMLIGRPADAQTACAAALAVDPERETTLFLAGILAMQSGRSAEAHDIAERLIRVNPWMWQYRQMLAESSAQIGDWRQTADACRQALQLEPANLPCRQLLIRALLRLGDTPQVRSELELCLSLMPPAERKRYRQSIEQQLR